MEDTALSQAVPFDSIHYTFRSTVYLSTSLQRIDRVSALVEAVCHAQFQAVQVQNYKAKLSQLASL
jgi:hypothetical protein